MSRFIIRQFVRTLLNQYKYNLNRIKFHLGVGKTAIFLKQNSECFSDCREALYQMAALVTDRDIENYINSYKNKTVKAIRVLDIPYDEYVPIFLCAVKDDLIRVKAQVEYHRSIGIKHFAYIDNMSTDGTFEWLLSQNDVSLFRVDEKYNGTVKNAWCRQVTDILGYDKWYLILDADEFFMYPEIESHPIHEYIKHLEQEKITSTLAFMLDMYAKEGLFNSSSVSPDNFRKDFCYFDTNTYKIQRTHRTLIIKGGPRSRLFSTGNLLTKYPLIKLTKSMLVLTHSNLPNRLNFESSLPIAVLLHYKFLPYDVSIYEDRMNAGIYANGSRAYKAIMKQYESNPEISFYYDKSQKLNSSMDLLQIEILNKNFFMTKE